MDRADLLTSTDQTERRSGTDRRNRVRRAGADRRRRSRRSVRVEVTSDHRQKNDRRTGHRRGVFDRRGRVGRRLTDRRRETPAPFSHEDTVRLRLMVQADPMLVTCPLCHRHVPATRPDTGAGTEIWEVRCPDCHRTALITGAQALRVLLVYGDATVRDALTVVLRRAGHRLVAVVAPGEGLDLEELGQVTDVAIVDLQLPAMQGIDVIRNIKRHRPDIEVVALAGRRQIGVPDLSVTAKRLGAAVVLRKPFTPPAILGALSGLAGA